MTSRATVSISWARTLLGEARAHGLDTAILMGAAGIPEEELAQDRWPIDYITRLWRAAAKLTKDPGIGLKAGAHMGPASLNLVGFIVQSATTLRVALSAVQRYQGLVSEGGRFQLLGGNESSWLIHHPIQGELAFSPHQSEAALSAVVTAVHWVHPNPTPPQLVRFSHERLGPLGAYRDVFQCRVEFRQAFSGLLFDNAMLDSPLPQGDARLAHTHEQLAEARMKSMQPVQAADKAVLAWLHEHMGPPLPTRAEAARAFGLTERTLARRLQSFGTSFAELLDTVRRNQAMEQVRRTDKLLKDIAHDLGFAGLSPFHRAFQRWTGSGPGEWRRRK